MRYAPLVLFHICTASLGLLSGGVAMVFRKGSSGHRWAGNVFVLSMLSMAGSAAYIALTKSETPNFLGGVLTLYMVATAWWAAKRRDGQTGLFDWSALLIALALGAAFVTYGLEARISPTGLKNGYPATFYFIFGSGTLLSAAGDIRMLARGGVLGAFRIVRHLWRMSFALLFAVSSFFLGQQKVMPPSWRGSKLLFVPPLLVLLTMLYWLIRIKFPNVFKRKSSNRSTAAQFGTA